jgi:uncharacterized protein (TIGR00661 family)
LKLFYAVQATGNGHIARAIELFPYLKQYGTVDFFLSGSNSDLKVDLPVVYRSKGLSLLYHKNGGLDYLRMLKELSIVNAYRDAKALPLEKYDLVINDFESITAASCRIKKIPSVNFGHQASFQSNNVPKPFKKDAVGELILKKFATGTNYVGLHFKEYDDFIFNPIIKKDILNAQPGNQGYITVYLSHYADEIIAAQLFKIPDIRFEVFSKKIKKQTVEKNITFIPISNKAFNESLINSAGIITGAGFETPAEALYLGKKLLCLPIKGQYEQLSNAEALKSFDVPTITSIDNNFPACVVDWLQSQNTKQLVLKNSTEQIVQHVLEHSKKIKLYTTGDLQISTL